MSPKMCFQLPLYVNIQWNPFIAATNNILAVKRGSTVHFPYRLLPLADTNKGIDQCYSRNLGSNGQFGNCGHDPSQGQFISCAPGSEMCGVLFCEPGDFTNPNSVFTTIITVSNRDDNGVFRDCRGSVTLATSDAVNPGLVDDGTKCGDDMV